jgi:hypothetical protein
MVSRKKQNHSSRWSKTEFGIIQIIAQPGSHGKHDIGRKRK